MINKEIEKRVKCGWMAQQKAVTGLASSLNDDFYKAVQVLSKRKGKIIVTGLGKSSFVGMKLSATLVSLGHDSFFLHPVEAMHGDMGVVKRGDVIIVLSFSGNTVETLKIATYLKNSFNTPIISITGNSSSSLAKLADISLVIDVKEEGSPHNLAPMASTTATLVIGDLLATALTSPVSFEKHHFAKFHPGGSLGLSLVKVKDIMYQGEDIPLVGEYSSLQKVLNVMSIKKRKGITGVLNKDKKLVGIITDGDLRRFFRDKDNFKKKVQASDMMTIHPKTITKEATLKEALSLIEESKVTSLFVVNEKQQVQGFIHIHTILEDYVI